MPERLPYLLHLTGRLATGLARLPARTRERHARYLCARQNPDGGFSGREGDSDLYYTAFALRGLAVLDALDITICNKAADFLRQKLTEQTTVVDFFSFLYACALVEGFGGPSVLVGSASDWRQRVAGALETLHTSDGGYGKAPKAVSGSTYHTFLVTLCYELIGQPLPRPEDAVRFVRSRRRDDGGFVESPVMRRSGANPTAAAIGTLQIVLGDAIAQEDLGSVIDYLAQMPSMEGGLRANDRIPVADLLSTFTGSWTLAELGALDRLNKSEVLNFARALDQPTGGFKGSLWDDRVDVEYTFYGLGVLALLSD